MSGRLLTVKDLVEQWGVGKSYVYELIALGELATVDLGRGDRHKYRIEESDAADFVERNKTRRSA